VPERVIRTMHHAYHTTHADARRTCGTWAGSAGGCRVDLGPDVDRRSPSHPVFAGFFSKDEILASVFGRGAGRGVFPVLGPPKNHLAATASTWAGSWR
jgi:hypothetical protein